jgi:hypothetical protein
MLTEMYIHKNCGAKEKFFLKSVNKKIRKGIPNMSGKIINVPPPI